MKCLDGVCKYFVKSLDWKCRRREGWKSEQIVGIEISGLSCC